MSARGLEETIEKVVGGLMVASINGRIAANNVDDTPLLSKDGATVATSVNSDEQLGSERTITTDGFKSKPSAAQIFKAFSIILMSAAGAAASIASFLLAPYIIVYVAGGICVMNFPMVTYKERKLLRNPSRKKSIDRLRDTTEQLKREADFLEKEIEYLLEQMTRYGGVEEELRELARARGFKADELIELVRLNEETMDLMRENLRQKVIEDVIGIVIRSEKDSGQRIDRVEAKLLALKITVKLEAYGIEFDEDKFLQAVALNPTMWGVASTVQKLLPPDEEQGDNMSIISDKDDVYDMFYMARDDNSVLSPRIPEGSYASLAARRQPAAESRHLPLTRNIISGRA